MKTSRRITTWVKLPVAAFAALGLVLLPASTAAARGEVYDNGWECYRGGATVYFPQMYRNNPAVTREGVYVQPILFRLENGEWVMQPNTIVVSGVSTSQGMAHHHLTGTWLVVSPSPSGLVPDSALRFQTQLSPGDYAVVMAYRFESTDWRYFISNSRTTGNFQCKVPK